MALGVAGFIFLKAMAVETAASGPEVLVAAAAMQPRTLLRAQDVTWQKSDRPGGGRA